MVELKDIKKIYFIGIGGIGMSALARYFHFHGAVVSGYDKTSTVLTRQLENEGIPVHYVDDVSLAPMDVDMVVYTPAVPRDHQELVYFQANGYPVLKRSEILGVITAGSFNICVAGTHGKTTITTMVAHLLRHSGYGCNAFLGGISVNYDSNFWSDKRNVCVVEADEYDRSFLKLSPDIAVVTAMDADHLDIYGTGDAVEQAFIEFSGRLKKGGMLVRKAGLRRGQELQGDVRVSYGVGGDTATDGAHLRARGAMPGDGLAAGRPDVYASDVELLDGSYRFKVVGPDWVLDKIVLNMGGMHNVENVTAAIAVAHHLGISDDKIRAAVEAFRGVKRRFEYIYRKDGLVFIDDYAHHPEELRALISGARGLFPKLKCTVIFQPHLFTRTRDFADGFAESLALADEVLLLPIYPARELPIAGVTSGMLASRMDESKVRVVEKEAALEAMKGRTGGLIITAGAGDIDVMVGKIKDILIG